MKALRWHGRRKVSVDDVPDPVLKNPSDIIVKVSSIAICGTDLHIYNGLVPDMKEGDILGHEFMGHVVDKGTNVQNLNLDDRVVIPAVIACGQCEYCQNKLYSLCKNSNPNATQAKKKMTQSPSGVFDYSHLTGGYAGGQAEYVRVPYADIGALKIESSLNDEQVLFLSDILPTGYMAAENCNIQKGDTVAVWGCGPVGQMAMQSAKLLGAERIIAIDRIPERLKMAEVKVGAETIDFSEVKVFERIMELTNGEGVGKCIDAVGTEVYEGCSLEARIDHLKQSLFLSSDRPHALREAIRCWKKGGIVSVPGVYLGNIDKFPFSEIMNKNLIIKSGNTHMHRYLKMLLDKINSGEIDPTFIISHRHHLKDAPIAYDKFNKKTDGYIKVVMHV